MTGAQGPTGPTGPIGTITIAQTSNTNTTTNLNTVLGVEVPLVGTTEFLDAGFSIPATPNRIQCDFTGRVEVSFNVYATSVGVRPSLDFRITRNGTPIAAPIFNQMYIRNLTGHANGGTSGTYVLSVTSGDQIGIEATRASSATDAVTLAAAGSSFLLLKRLP